MSFLGDLIVAAIEAAVKGNFTAPQGSPTPPPPAEARRGPRNDADPLKRRVLRARPPTDDARQAAPAAGPIHVQAHADPVTRGSIDRSQAALKAIAPAVDVAQGPETVLDDLFGDRQALVRAVIVSEILGPPRSLSG